MPADEQLKRHEIENTKLKRMIKELEEKLESKEIIIDALVGKFKLKKKSIREDSESIDYMPKSKKSKSNVTEEEEHDIFKILPIIGDEVSKDEELPVNTKELINNESDTTQSVVKLNEEENNKLLKEVKSLFSPKNRKQEFKSNITFSKFVEYAETSYEFNLNNKKVSKSKNPLKMYINTHSDKIIKYLIDNIRILNLNQICSTLFLINPEMDYQNKLVVAHDFIIEIDNNSRLLFILSALFNNLELEDDKFSSMLKSIIHHQFCIDSNLFKDTEIFEHFHTIHNNLLQSIIDQNAGNFPSVWDLATSLVSFAEFFVKKTNLNQKRTVRPEAIENGFILRALMHYLDWDYAYNNIVVNIISPMLVEEKKPIYAYYLGILALNSFRLFGKNKSAIGIFKELEEFMVDSSDLSVACYLIIKQINENDAEKWLKLQNDSLIESGFDIEYLRGFLLL